MRVKKPDLHPMTRPALAEIQAAGVEITPEIVVWVDSAAKAIRKTAQRSSDEIIDFPVKCGGVWLYPLSFGAVGWLVKLPVRMQNDSRVIAFACAHSRDIETLSKLTGTVAVTLAIAKWTLSLSCSATALSKVVDLLIGCGSYVDIPDHTGKRRDSDDDWEWSTVIKALCMKYPGSSPDYWMWGVSREKATHMIWEIQEELPKDIAFTEYEINANNEFRSIVESLKAGKNV